jgi:hypothetical protein
MPEQVTWVLIHEPSASVLRMLELIEEKVASPAPVIWLVPVEGPNA